MQRTFFTILIVSLRTSSKEDTVLRYVFSFQCFRYPTPKLFRLPMKYQTQGVLKNILNEGCQFVVPLAYKGSHIQT
jgi:hypothetical protein